MKTQKSIAFVLAGLICTTLQAQWYWQNPLPQGNALNDVQYLDQNTIIAAGSVGTFIRSADGGNTWNILSIGTDGTVEAVCFSGMQKGTAVGFEGIFNTSDGGLTWQEVSLPIAGFRWFMDLDYADVNNGTAVGVSGLIRRTRDGGTTWTLQASNTTQWLYAVDCIDGNTATAVGAGGTIIRTTDGGQTWTAQNSAVTETLKAVSFANSLVGVASGGTKLLYTTDGGNHWSTAEVPSSFSWAYNHALLLDTKVGYAFGTASMLKTTNGGKSWVEVNRSSSSFVDGIDFYDSSHGMMVCSTGRIYRTGDGGLTWDDLYTDVARNELVGVYFPDENIGYAVGANETILKTINGGASWSKIRAGISPDYLGVFFTDADHGVVVGEGGKIMRTTDGGLHWTAATSGSLEDLWWVDFPTPETGYAVGDYGAMVKSVDGGSTWTALSSGTTADLMSVKFMDSQTGIAIGDRGIILKTTDGGGNWYMPTSPTIRKLWAVSFANAVSGTAVGEWGTILRTTDGGETWQEQESGTSQPLFGVSFYHPEKGFAVGGPLGIPAVMLQTEDGGETWMKLPAFCGSQLDRVFARSAGTVVAVGVAGTIVGTKPGGLVSDEKIIRDYSQGMNILSQNYPNPFSTSTLIPFEMPADDYASLKVYNYLGRELMTLFAERLTQGRHEFVLKGTGLEGGVYYYTLRTGQRSQTRKLLLLKQ